MERPNLRAFIPHLCEATLLVVIAVLPAACSSHSARQKTATPPSAPTTLESASPIPPTGPPSPALTSAGVAFIDSSHGWVARTSGGGPTLLATRDGGATWSTHDLGGASPSIVAFADANHGWIAGTSGSGCGSPPLACTALLSTADGGTSWTSIKLRTNDPIVQVALAGPDDGWILTDACRDFRCPSRVTELYETTGGAPWQPLNSQSKEPIMFIQRVDVNTGWAMSESYLSITHDDGRAWTVSNNPCHLVQPGWDGVLFATGPMSFADASNGWIACRGPGGGGTAPGTLYRTSDGGLTWSLIGSTPEPTYPLQPGSGVFPGTSEDIRFFDSQNGWLVGGHQDGMWRTENGGHDWRLVGTGVPDISRLDFADPTNVWAHNSGVILHTSDGGIHWERVEPPQ